MSTDAQKRIKTVEQFSAIGSGIQIAMKDLEIRGAGDLLGGEQSGFINEMGFETYQKILQQAIEELKENEFKSIYNKDENNDINFFTNEIQIDTDLEILIPDHYVNIVKERLALYQELSKIKTNIDLEEFEIKLRDRFGPLPLETVELIESVRLKWIVTKLGIERLIIKNGNCLCFFISNQKSDFFQSEEFNYIIYQIQKKSDRLTLKEKITPDGPKLILSVNKIKDIKSLKSLLNQLVYET